MVGGANFASSELTSNSLDNRPAVQVGDPFIEKVLLKLVDAFKTGDVIAAQDMEQQVLHVVVQKWQIGLGISINLDLVPAREKICLLTNTYYLNLKRECYL